MTSPELLWWPWFISSVFLTRITCHKITHQMITMEPAQRGQFRSVYLLQQFQPLLPASEESAGPPPRGVGKMRAGPMGELGGG